MKLNGNFQNLEQSYLFVTIAKKVAAYTQEHPDNKIIKMGIGDVTMPLAPAVIEAMHDATEEQAHKETFHGYSPDSDGYPFLREAIASYYKNFGVDMDASEVFVGDGAKSDVGNIVDLFDVDNTVLVPDPVYPVYVDTNIISGRKIAYMDANEGNGFLPLPDASGKGGHHLPLLPQQPHRRHLRHGASCRPGWTTPWSRRPSSCLTRPTRPLSPSRGLPHCIFEIPGAEKCAIEFCSLSKTAGFTGMRCGYTVIRKELVMDGVQVSKLWQRRQGCKFNGTSYITQRAAAAVFTAGGPEADPGDHRLLPEERPGDDGRLPEDGRVVHRRHQLPLHLAEVPGRHGLLGSTLTTCCTTRRLWALPGEGFGKNGEGYFRLTAFGDAQKTVEAMERIQGSEEVRGGAPRAIRALGR